MAFSFILRRSASSFAPLAARALRSQRNCHFAIFTALNQTRNVSGQPRLSPFLPPHSYSTKRPSSDENLLLLLGSEIQCAEETDDHDRVDEAPGGFPFKIEDKPGFKTITLSREYRGEEIKVVIRIHDVVFGEDGGDDNQDDDDEKANQWSIPLVVSIAKGNGQFIKIYCTAYHPKSLVINRVAVKNPEYSEDQIAYEGTVFQDSADVIAFEGTAFLNTAGVLKAFRKYLEARGIKPSMANFLHEYLISKDTRDYLMDLKNLEKFVEA